MHLARDLSLPAATVQNHTGNDARWRGVARLMTVLLLIPMLAACALPRGAAMQSEVLRGTQGEDSDYQVVEVSRAALSEINSWPRPAGAVRYSWVGTGASATTRLIRAGDQISLAIWDSQDTSLLTTFEQRFADMRDISVSTSGRIFVPYVGEITVSGMTAETARRDIQERMEAIVPDAQVQLTVTPGSGNTIDVVTGVASPGRVPLTEISPTILTVLAEAGGISPGLRNPLVRLQRAGVSYEIPAHRLFSEPAQDIQLRGGDRILVEQDSRNFVALGASGRQEVVYFEREEINALDALSTIGGLSSARADLRGVMVLREYAQSDVRAEGAYPRKPWVIFTFDLTNADGLFAAQRFLIQPNDVVLATESPVPAMQQVLSLFRIVRNTF
ncbi:MAG: polysaccharide export protein [Pararhodobacter sp.]|nr:polysaccharide export protein [Pararhodobacter sp.]